MRYLALILLLCSCSGTREPLDSFNSYRMTPAHGQTQPRAFHGQFPVGDRYTPADIQAVKELRVDINIAPGVTTDYTWIWRHMELESTIPRPVVLHESTHVGTFDSEVPTTPLEREAIAMVSEVACLMQEGWSDARIRSLSPNNAKTPQWVFNWMRANGPHFTGMATDVRVAYLWGKSPVTIAAVRSLVAIAPAK